MQAQAPHHPAHRQAQALLHLPLLPAPALLNQAQAALRCGLSVAGPTAAAATAQTLHTLTSSAEVGPHAAALTAPGGSADLLVRSSAQAAARAKAAAQAIAAAQAKAAAQIRAVAVAVVVEAAAVVPAVVLAAAAVVAAVAMVVAPAAAAHQVVPVHQLAVGHQPTMAILGLSPAFPTAAQAVRLARVQVPVLVLAGNCYRNQC